MANMFGTVKDNSIESLPIQISKENQHLFEDLGLRPISAYDILDCRGVPRGGAVPGNQFTVKQLALPALLHHHLHAGRAIWAALEMTNQATLHQSDCMWLARLVANTKCHVIRVEKPRHCAFCTKSQPAQFERVKSRS